MAFGEASDDGNFLAAFTLFDLQTSCLFLGGGRQSGGRFLRFANAISFDFAAGFARGRFVEFSSSENAHFIDRLLLE